MSANKDSLNTVGGGALAPDLTEARRLLAAGMKLTQLTHNMKRPIGLKWHLPNNYAKTINPTATGYGLPLAANNLCSVDPDHLVYAELGMRGLGFNLEDLMAAGARTKSTREGSGGRSLFAAPKGLAWLSFKSPQTKTVIEFRAGASNLQDCVAGLTYFDKQGVLCTQTLANEHRSDAAPALPEAFAAWWLKCSTDIEYYRSQQRMFFSALPIEARASESISVGESKTLAFEAKGYRVPFNEAHDVEEMLIAHGYDSLDGGARYAPHTATGAPSVRAIPNRVGLWQSDHASDPLQGTFDAWIAYVVLEHGGNLQAACEAQDVIQRQQTLGLMTALPHLEVQALSSSSGSGAAGAPPSIAFNFKQFSMLGESSVMKHQLLDETYVLGKIALLGQSTIFYAKPNAGKTLITLYLLIKAIEEGKIDPSDVHYVNVDDSHRGFVDKLVIAEKYGFNMLADGHKGFQCKMLPEYLEAMIDNGSAREQVLILDTVKKFTDVMDKRLSSDFGKIIRRFLMAGGTCISLAHVNKHRDDDGRVVSAGTSDLTDDCDAVYTLDVSAGVDGWHTVTFDGSQKTRGGNELKVCFKFHRPDNGARGDYSALLASVTRVGAQEVAEARTAAEKLESLIKNAAAIAALTRAIASGVTGKTELTTETFKQTGSSRRVVVGLINLHAGDDWQKGDRWVEIYDSSNNKSRFELLTAPPPDAADWVDDLA